MRYQQGLTLIFNAIFHIEEFIRCLFVGKFIFASLVVTFRHGREEDEVMGISFKKELVVDRVQVYPETVKDEANKVQVGKPYFLKGSFNNYVDKRGWVDGQTNVYLG